MKRLGDQIPYSLSLFPSFPLSHSPLSPFPQKSAAAFATLTCQRTTPTESTAPTDQLKLGTEPQTAPAPGERWPVHRTGSDRELPGWLWRCVAERDDWTCKICHEVRPKWSRAWEIDHIVPWSAGGPDDSTNLRLTCAGCNRRRSNYVDPFARPMPPVINRCEWEYDNAQTTRAWCALHRRWESVPADYARRYELSKVIARRAETQTGQQHLDAARTTAAAAKTAWDRRKEQQ